MLDILPIELPGALGDPSGRSLGLTARGSSGISTRACEGYCAAGLSAL